MVTLLYQTLQSTL